MSSYSSSFIKSRALTNKYLKPIQSEPETGPRTFFWSPSKSGVVVNSDNALEIDTVLTCIRVLSESIACLPLDLYNRADENNVVKAREHPVFDLLRWEPNPEMTAYELKLWLLVDCLLRGNGVAQVLRNSRGQVKEIWPLLASKIRVKRRESNGKLFYTYPAKDGKEAVLEQNEVFHIKGFINGGLLGISIVDLQKDGLGTAKSANDYSSEFFANGSIPTGVIEVPEEMSDTAYNRLKQDWTDTYTGEGNRHKAPILEGGAKFNSVLLNHEESQLLETRKFHRSTISGLFRVPAHLINDLEKATFSNIEHQDLGFVKHTLRPWLTNIEQRCRLAMLSPAEKKTFYFKHNLNDLLRGDFESRMKGYGTGVQNGIWSPNDVRRKEDENPYEGGDVYLANGTLTPVVQAGQQINQNDNTGTKPNS